jgi:hypothetical protein
MATARELLEQADALMRRNRTRQIDTEIPELTDAIATPVIEPQSPPAVAPVALDDIPELTDAVEEIEIASIVEIPEDEPEANTWLRTDDEALAAEIDPRPAARAPQFSRVPEPIGGRVLPLFAIAAKPHESVAATPSAAEPDPIIAAMTGVALAKAPVVELPHRDAVPAQDREPDFAHGVASASTAANAQAEEAPGPPAEAAAAVSGERAALAEHDTADAPDIAAVGDTSAAPDVPAAGDTPPGHESPPQKIPADANDWARWQALAEEIRMQVLQRIDIFTDTRLREQLAVQMRPIVERASAEMIETINSQVGELLRAYIAEAIEREIDKWRQGNN